MTEQVVPKLTKEQYELLVYLEQSFWRTGSLPSYEAIVANGIELAEEVYYQAWINPRFVESLRSRGVPEHLLKTESGTFKGRILTEKQMQVANVLLDTLDKRSRLKKLTELGVSTTEYNQWLKDPLYRGYCLERAEALLHENQHVAHMSLIDRVAQGDLGAIRYFNSMTGRYREKQSAAVEINNVSLNNFGTDTLIAVVEIIQKHVKDPEVLAAIGDEILALNRHNPQAHDSQAQTHGRPVGVGNEIAGQPALIQGTVDYGV